MQYNYYNKQIIFQLY